MLVSELRANEISVCVHHKTKPASWIRLTVSKHLVAMEKHRLNVQAHANILKHKLVI